MKAIDIIKNKSIDELAEWLNKYCDCDFYGTPWDKWFDKNYCSKCEPEISHIVEDNIDMEFGWCELNDKCKFFQNIDNIPDNKDIIKMWLESEGNLDD